MMIAKYVLRAVHEMGAHGGHLTHWTANVSGQAVQPRIGTPLPDPPQVVSPFVLRATNDPATATHVL
jgi:hypothetical protein